MTCIACQTETPCGYVMPPGELNAGKPLCSECAEVRLRVDFATSHAGNKHRLRAAIKDEFGDEE